MGRGVLPGREGGCTDKGEAFMKMHGKATDEHGLLPNS